MKRSCEKLGRVPAPRRPIQTKLKSVGHGFLRSRIEGKTDLVIRPCLSSAAPSRSQNMIKPLTQLAPWRAAAGVTGRTNAAAPLGNSRIPQAARGKYPLTARA